MKRKFFARVAVSALCLCTFVLPALSPSTALAAQTGTLFSESAEALASSPLSMTALTGQTMATGTKSTMELPGVPSYDSVFRVSNEHVLSIRNNAGHYGQSVITKAVDGNPATHWETNKPNNSSFQNIVTVNFDAVYKLAKINYQARQDAGAKGFPLQYKLYYSATEHGDDFQLLKEGNFASVTTKVVSIEFEPTNIRRIQFEFVKANADWASMAEISFYKYDSLSVRMNDIFTDGTFSALKHAYQNQATLDRLKAEAASHPNRDTFLTMLADAQILLENPGVFDNRVVTASQRGNVAKEKSRTKTNYGMFAYDSTGYYVSPGETLHVYVDADKNGVMPQLVFGQIANDKGGWGRRINLQPGMNVVTAQTMDKMNPAAIYISNEALPEDQDYAPRVRVAGGTKFPMYVHGKTDTQTFRTELEEYLKNVSYNDSDFANGNPNGYYYNIAEYVSENNIISTSAAGALNEVKAVVNRGSSVEEEMDAWENMYFEFARYSGYDLKDETSQNYRPRGKFMSRVFSSCPFGFADYGYTGYLGGEPPKRASGFYASMLTEPTRGGWAVYHEWGHIYDNNAIGRGESTNNLYSLILQDIYISNNRMVQENRWENHFTKYHNTKVYPDDQLFYGAMIYQLQAIYGKDLYGKAQVIARSNPNGVLNGLTSNKDRLAVAISLAAEVDLTSHFDYYGEKEFISEKAKSIVAHLPAVDKKTYYVNQKNFAADASAFTTENPQPQIKAAANKGAVLTMAINEPENAILCYEIYRDGEFLAVTYSPTYTDVAFEENKEHTYSVIAYDRKLNPSEMSDAVSINPSLPIVKTADLATAALYKSFDPMEYITAKDVKGNNIKDRIKVLNNTVDTNKKGDYSVTYEISDKAGNTVVVNMPVKVVSTVTYLSDLKEVRAKVGWGKFTKDQSSVNTTISLTTGMDEKTFTKGLGVHADSEVVYNIADQGYDYFEAFVGIDNYHRSSSVSSAKFEVWVDGERVYESGLFKAKTPMEQVRVDVAGAKEVKLITTDGGNGPSADITDWADAKFAILDSKPVIAASDNVFEPGDVISIEALASKATASDIEDGDLTEKIEYTTNYVPNQTGNFNITYKVTDSDGNTTEVLRKLAVVNSFVYLSDTNWKSASTGWGTVSKDVAVSGKTMSLLGESGVQTYKKGIGTHATSQIVYDLTGKDYYFFSSFVGVDRSGGNYLSSIVFKVYVDGKLVEETPVMKYNDPQQFIKVSLVGAKELKLVVTDGGNGNGNDHGNWADAKFLTATDKADKLSLYRMKENADTIVNHRYTLESWQIFEAAKDNAAAVLEDTEANQAQVDSAVVQLQTAIDGLEFAVNLTELETVLALADKVDVSLYTQASLNILSEAKKEATTVLNDLLSTQVQVDAAAQKLQTAIDNLQRQADKAELRGLLTFADAMSDQSYVNPKLSHKQIRWENLQGVTEDAKRVDRNTDVSQKEVDAYAYYLLYFIEETGQQYEKGATPTVF